MRFARCEGLEELGACVRLQIETWGYDESDVVPRKAFLVAQKIGGQVIGAFDSAISGGGAESGAESLVGFAFSLPGVKSGQGEPRAYLHSHMLAVKEGYRNHGLGTQLKLEQRREALSRGIRLMEWTFDPLEIKNAFLNIHRLGAVVREYRVNFYGLSSSRLQGGLPTDRLLAEWRLDSSRVRQFNGGSPWQPSILLRNVYWFLLRFTNGRQAKRGGDERSPFRWRTAGSFKRHFLKGWPYSASTGMRKEMESSNWAPSPKR